MKNIFEGFRKFVKESSQSIEDLVNHYYSDLPEEEKQEKIATFSNRLNQGIQKNGEWIRKTLMHSLEQKMKIEIKIIMKTMDVEDGSFVIRIFIGAQIIRMYLGGKKEKLVDGFISNLIENLKT